MSCYYSVTETTKCVVYTLHSGTRVGICVICANLNLNICFLSLAFINDL